jgi:hypothetical protein
VRFSPLERIVTHNFRLDILCCLDGEPLTISKVSARIDKNERHVAHHMKMLDSFDLVGQEGETEAGQPLYVARIKEHPTWVMRAINKHRLPPEV